MRPKEILIWISLILFIIAFYLRLTTKIDYEIFGVVKPITIIQYSGFIIFAYVLTSCRDLMFLIKKEYFDIIIILLFMAVMATLFEMQWSFGYWFSTYQLDVALKELPQGSQVLDNISYTPSSINRRYLFEDSTSLNQSAKKNTLFFMMSVYTLWFFINIKKERFD